MQAAISHEGVVECSTSPWPHGPHRSSRSALCLSSLLRTRNRYKPVDFRFAITNKHGQNIIICHVSVTMAVICHVSVTMALTNQIDGRTWDSAISHVPLTFEPELALPAPNQLIQAMRYCKSPPLGWYLQSRTAKAWLNQWMFLSFFRVQKVSLRVPFFRGLLVRVEFRFHDDKHNLSW